MAEHSSMIPRCPNFGDSTPNRSFNRARYGRRRPTLSVAVSCHMKRVLLAAVLMASAAVATAQDGLWKNDRGEAQPDTASRQSKNDFGGWLFATTDEDWQAKWRTPPSHVPRFNEAKAVRIGQKVFVLIFFANPALTSENKASIRCDLKIARPDNTTSIDARNLACFDGPIDGSPYSVFLSAPVIEFVGEAGDPLGTWVVEVVLTDALRDTTLALRTSFVLR